ncbi:Putative auto-transporter adhesin, head GIN domain [Pricia antarctica]|uniref:Putative auto-transporter adhesin, head GIN domain n=1 Tax=Pricia antarctica TaxID=641691 RepID=A0A1G7C639_9FLAO|nr:DUF2807 domain-containing protein [Pricia antarctica]SDE34136.1 Putative auto-transporter adhesin, head GIN domain [Pricia antarctica]
MKIRLGILVLLFGLTLSAQDTSTFSSYETLEGVKIIQIQDNLCAILYPTHFFGVQIKGDKRLKDIIKWDFKDAVLKLYTTEENTTASYAEITLYVKDFEELRLSGNASVQTDEKMVMETFILNSGGNSSYNFPMECTDFTLISAGESTGYLDLTAESVHVQTKNNASTSIKTLGGRVSVELTDNSIVGLRGTAHALSATVNKKARLTAWALKAEDVYLFSSSTADIEIYAKNRLKINGQANSKIYVTGYPRQIDTININKKTNIFYHARN